MSQTTQAPAPQRISDLKVSGHLMTLQTGLFCVFLAPGQQPPTAAGLPGVRLSQPPVRDEGNISIVTFDEDGWLGGQNGAALIRVQQGPAQVLVTVYQELGSPHDAPRLQVVQLSHNANAGPVAQHAPVAPPAPAAAAAPAQPAPAPAASNPYAAEIGAHIQRRGDVMSRVGEWMGEPGSHAWIEGFGVAPSEMIGADDIEYQAVLGKGWLSPWVEGGKYCGSRGMALPILGLCIRLKGKAAKKYICRVTATFTDGTRVGPVDNGEPIETASLAPLEAFLLEILPREEGGRGKGRRGGKGRNAAAEAEAAADLAALLEEEIEEAEVLEELEELEAEADDSEEFELFIEEELPPAKPARAPRGGRPAGKGRSAKVAASERAPAKPVGRPRKAAAASKAAPAKAAPSGRGRGRKPTSRR
ncbi:MAG: hypothetical protein ABF443_11410 [Acetobacter malorum]|uniref:hypothetical protein n=1 Tax=Acetobacter malorum TaxID=178901 RepID=UPI0039EA348B